MNKDTEVMYFEMANGLNLTDTYWVKVDGEETFGAVSLYRKEHVNAIVQTALYGTVQPLPNDINPELTNIGSFEKVWVKEGKQWWLYKRGSFKNIYAELFAY